MLNKTQSVKSRIGNEENVIIVTEIGKQKIEKQNDWIDQNFQDPASLNNSNITVDNVTSYFGGSKIKQPMLRRMKMCFSVSNSLHKCKNNQNRQKQNNTFYEQYSTKVMKRQKQWTSTRDNFSRYLKQTLQLKSTQKCKEIQWPQQTNKYRKNIAQILQNWQTAQETQQNRTKMRLQNIYKERYRIKKGQRKQKTTNFEQRSFNEPTKNSQINYGGAEEQQKVENKQNKIYYRIKKKWNQSFQYL